MKKLISLMLSFCILIVAVTPLASASDTVQEPKPLVNERVIQFLEKNNIDFHIENGNIILTKVTTNDIALVNELLISDQQINRNALTSYPTAWTHMINYDVVTSKKFKKATKTAFVTAVLTFIGAYASPAVAQVVATSAGVGWGGYYFVNTDEEDIYTFIKYYYRELSAGFFDHNGNFIGDYEIKKEIRLTKSSNGTGGTLESFTRNSSIVEPWF
ncbi:hypothetical protein [Cohnella phaseoli]|uniref:Uncharacterized protein n=1 Tax=Cohnella phaseoli TaxID=456490 RepID=A0A3D9I9U2_9BACL|nr:hypothetical protein [Cohnella phaseoli]RED57936.1 hypothetical protein DFP98_13531 [Cohnella phaseoli]